MNNDKKVDEAAEALDETRDVRGHDAGDDGDQDFAVTVTGGTCNG